MYKNIIFSFFPILFIFTLFCFLDKSADFLPEWLWPTAKMLGRIVSCHSQSHYSKACQNLSRYINILTIILSISFDLMSNKLVLTLIVVPCQLYIYFKIVISTLFCTQSGRGFINMSYVGDIFICFWNDNIAFYQ